MKKYSLLYLGSVYSKRPRVTTRIAHRPIFFTIYEVFSFQIAIVPNNSIQFRILFSFRTPLDASTLDDPRAIKKLTVWFSNHTAHFIGSFLHPKPLFSEICSVGLFYFQCRPLYSNGFYCQLFFRLYTTPT